MYYSYLDTDSGSRKKSIKSHIFFHLQKPLFQPSLLNFRVSSTNAPKEPLLHVYILLFTVLGLPTNRQKKQKLQSYLANFAFYDFLNWFFLSNQPENPAFKARKGMTAWSEADFYWRSGRSYRLNGCSEAWDLAQGSHFQVRKDQVGDILPLRSNK